jgi:hypothetical protein
MRECVMSVYGMTRLLRARELGPAQLLPTIHEFGAGLGGLCAQVEGSIVALAADARGESPQPSPLRGEMHLTLTALAALSHRLGEELRACFDDVDRLSARERLALERSLTRLGGSMEAAHYALSVCEAAREPRPIVLSLDELLRGRWISPPSFVERRVELYFAPGAGPRFVTDPRLLWGLIEEAVAGPDRESSSHVAVERAPNGLAVLRFGHTLPAQSTMERFTLELHPSLGLETPVLAAAARTLGCTTSVDAETVSIALAAA